MKILDLNQKARATCKPHRAKPRLLTRQQITQPRPGRKRLPSLRLTMARRGLPR